AWKLELPGAGASSPTILGDRVYVTSYSGYGVPGGGGKLADLKLHVIAIDRKSGDIVWQKEVEPKQPESNRVRDHGYAAPTPTTDGERLYVFFGKTGVLAFDLDGNKLWQTSVGNGTDGWGCGTSPVLFENLVIVNASVESGSLVALDKTTGDKVWSTKGMNRSWNTPCLVELDGGKTELAVSVRGKILGFDPKTGEQLWSCEGIQDYVCPSAVAKDGVVYVIGGRQSKAIAVRAGGRGDVTDSHRAWEAKAGANVCSPVIHDGYLYWVSDRNQVAYCVDLKDGKVVYQKRFPAQPYASIVYGDGKLYVVSRFDGTYVLAAKPEFEELAHNQIEEGGRFNASPAIANGHLFLRSDTHLYCIGE
ncbi:MAG: PQQ-binding-like beta-propeller repeat protein, partial [Planctomycetaceae bacterium]|nr:PQQ-binding-like beta-propeller repeat protein [Planctomycetaceae bacterium]